jgi:hypothetical protein
VAEEIGIQAPRLAARLAVDAADRAALSGRWARFVLSHRRALDRERDDGVNPLEPAVSTSNGEARQWTLDGRRVADLAAREGAVRYLAWRGVADDLGLPRWVHVGWPVGSIGSVPDERTTVLFCTESPLAVDALFHAPAGASLVLTELAADHNDERSSTGALPA